MTDAKLSVNTAHPSRSDGPRAAGWGPHFLRDIQHAVLKDSVGVDALWCQESPSWIPGFSRSVWQAGGAFDEARNVSVGGNAVWVVQLDEDRASKGKGSIPPGDCNPAKAYAGPLRIPPSAMVEGDEVCGFANCNVAWKSPGALPTTSSGS